MKEIDYYVAKKFYHNIVHKLTIYHLLIKSFYELT